MSAPWTEERETAVADLWTRGLSASEIAARYGITRNAVIGKVHRMGLKRSAPSSLCKRRPGAARVHQSHWKPEEDAALRRLFFEYQAWTDIARTIGRTQWAVARRAKALGLKRDHRPRRDNAKQAAKNRATYSRMGKEALRRVEAFADVTDAVPLMSRKAGMCAWPVGIPDRPANQLCCGKQADGSYCRKHREIGTTGDMFTPKDMSRLMKRFAA